MWEEDWTPDGLWWFQDETDERLEEVNTARRLKPYQLDWESRDTRNDGDDVTRDEQLDEPKNKNKEAKKQRAYKDRQTL